MTTNQPNDISSRLDQLTALMEDTAEVALAHNAALTQNEHEVIIDSHREINMNESFDLILSNLIIGYLETLPSDAFKDLTLTPDQSIYWSSMRRKTSLQARHWWSMLNLANDPLITLEEHGHIKQWDRVGITLYVNFYQRLWELVQSSEHYVSKFYAKKKVPYPFEACGNYSAASLFMRILRDLIDGEFSNCLLPYYKCSVQDTKNLAAYIQDSNVKPQKKNEVLAIAKARMHFKDHSWFILLLDLCQEKSKQDPIIEMRLKALAESIQEVASHLQTAIERKRSSSRFNKPVSNEWRDGECFAASSVGGSYAS